jgi:hypothetical protein
MARKVAITVTCDRCGAAMPPEKPIRGRLVVGDHRHERTDPVANPLWWELCDACEAEARQLLARFMRLRRA